MTATEGKDKTPLRTKLQALAEGLADTPDKAEAKARLAAEPPLQAHCANVWAIFLQLHMRRPQSEFGPMRLPYSEVEAYSRVTGQKLSRWYASVIFALDDEFFVVRAENEE